MIPYRMRSCFQPENDAPLVCGERLVEVPYEVVREDDEDEAEGSGGSAVADSRAA